MTLPSWEVSDLQTMQSKGQLYGVPAIDLELIAREESQGYGGAINPQGYGGFFGLGVKQAGSGLLSSTSSAAFETQARYSAYDFGTALMAVGGNPVSAEQYYQTGKTGGTPSSGAKLFAQQFGYGGSQMPTGIAGGPPTGSSNFTGGGSSTSANTSNTPNSPSAASNDVKIPLLGIDLSQIGRYAIFAVIALVILIIGGLILAGGTIGGGKTPMPIPV